MFSISLQRHILVSFVTLLFYTNLSISINNERRTVETVTLVYIVLIFCSQMQKSVYSKFDLIMISKKRILHFKNTIQYIVLYSALYKI